MTMHTLPIVGAHFRPPAKGLLAVLPKDTPLVLVPEPDNPYDENAVKVILVGEDIDLPDEAIDAACMGSGFCVDDVRGGTLHMGYVPRTEATWLQSRINGDLGAKLSFTIDGKPAVQFELEDR